MKNNLQIRDIPLDTLLQMCKNNGTQKIYMSLELDECIKRDASFSIPGNLAIFKIEKLLSEVYSITEETSDDFYNQILEQIKIINKPEKTKTLKAFVELLKEHKVPFGITKHTHTTHK